MKNLPLIFILIVLMSCKPNSINQWKTTSELQGTWVKLERDEQGYLYYEPCDGGHTSTLKIDGGQMLFQSGHEDPDSLSFASLDLKNSQTEIHFVASNKYHNIKGVLKRMPNNEKLFLFSWNFIIENDESTVLKKKMMMTRLDYKPQFRIVKNPCPTKRIQEKKFLPIEF